MDKDFKYMGIVRVVGLRYKTPKFEPDFYDMHVLVDILIRTDHGEDLYENCTLNLREVSDLPEFGSYIYVLIANGKIGLVD